MGLQDPEDAFPTGPRVEIFKDGPATNRPEPMARYERPSTVDDPLYKRLGVIEAYMARGEEREERRDSLFEQVVEELGDLKRHQTARSLEHAADSIEPNGLSGRTILVVEPDSDLLKRTAIALQNLGCFPGLARSRGEALTLLSTRGEFDLALVDLRSPQTEDGVELVRHFAIAHPAMPVVIMGTRLKAPELDSFRAARLKMPFTFETLHERLLEAIGEEAANRDTDRAPAFDSELPVTASETPEAKAQADASGQDP